jgi:phosphohistidine phosphatase
MDMQLYIVRHADALPIPPEDKRPPVEADEARPLSDLGRKQCELLAGTLKHLGVHLSQIVTSPLVRARQTGELLREHLGAPQPGLLDSEHLSPGAKRRKLSSFLNSVESGPIAIVGHNPDLSIYLGWLLGGKSVNIELAKAGVALVEFERKIDKGEGALMWLVSPEWYPAA